MWINVVIAAVVGVLAYGLTLYYNHYERPNIVVQPEASTLIEPQTGEPAPGFSFTDTKDEAHRLEDFKGKIVLLNFWASWCAPCIKEFPVLIDLVKENDNVVLLALSADIEEAAILRFIEKFKAQGLEIDHNRVFIGLDENSKIMRSLYQTYKMPETYIVDKNQILAHKAVGADWHKSDLQAIISSLN